MEIRSLHWWSTSQLEELAQKVEATWLAWQKEWVTATDKLDGSCDVQCTLPHESTIGSDTNLPLTDQDGWQPLLPGDTHDNSQIWMRVPGNFSSTLQTLLCNSSTARFGFAADEVKNSTLTAEIAEKAWHAWLTELGRFLKVSQPTSLAARFNHQPNLSKFPSFQNKPWSGAVRFSITCLGLSFELQLPADRIEILLPPHRSVTRTSGIGTTSITPLNQALNAQHIEIRARLASLELDLGSLQSLAIGNVIPLPHRLDQPLTVISENDAVLCTAHLVQHHGMRALELSRASESVLH